MKWLYMPRERKQKTKKLNRKKQQQQNEKEIGQRFTSSNEDI